MTIHLDVQVASKDTTIPEITEFKYWTDHIPCENETNACLRIVDELEARSLNKQFRSIDKATNVLSFPAEIPPEVGMNYLGDIVICAQVVNREAQDQSKIPNHHWAHLLVHGLLHLQGYDHEDDQTAAQMETLEIEILKKFNIPNPYE